MTTSRLSVYLDADLLEALEAYAGRRGKSKSIVAVAAIAAFLSPDAAEREEAAIARRLDRLARQVERLERDLGISVEMLALFVRFWLSATPPVPESAQAAARAKGRDRYEGFVEALGRRLAAGRAFTREISLDQPSASDGDEGSPTDPAPG
jgi:predicted transcriptional regulator